MAVLPIFAPAPKVGALGEIGIQYILYISSLSLLPWMACMQVLQEQMPAAKNCNL